MPKAKRHSILVCKAAERWVVSVDGRALETFRTKERALSWAQLWQETATVKGAHVELVVRDHPRAAAAI